MKYKKKILYPGWELKYFDKAKTGYYQKKRAGDNYPVNFIRGLLRQINFNI